MRKTVLTIGTIAMVTLGSTFMTDSVSAEKSLDEVQTERQELKSQLSKAESKIADVLYEIKDLNEDLVKLENVLKENQESLDKTELKIDEYEVEIDEINTRIEERNEILKNRIAAYQQNGGNVTFMDVVLGSEDFSQLISRSEAASKIASADKELMEEQQKDMLLVEEKVVELEDVKVDLVEVKYVTETQLEEVEKKKKTLKEKESELKEKKSALQSEDNDLASLESQIRAEIAAISESTTTNSAPQVASETATATSSPAAAASNGTASNKTSEEAVKNVPAPASGGSAINVGKSVMGTPYKWGGTSTAGFDCSGFVQWAYGQAGVSLPRATGGQASAGTKVPYSQAQAGDLVFFTNPGGAAHVGIYLGGGQFLGSQSSTGVAIASMSSGYWKNAFNGNVRRVK